MLSDSSPASLPSARTVIESERFTGERERLDPSVRRMDQALTGVVSILATTPTLGQQTNKPGIWAMPTKEWDDVPLVIYYSFDSETVVLESVVRAPLEDSPADK